MDEKIKYYVDLLNNLQEKIAEDDKKILEYDILIQKEKMEFYKLPFFERLFSGRKKLIKSLSDTLSAMKYSRNLNLDQSEQTRKEMVEVGKLTIKCDQFESIKENEIIDLMYQNLNNILLTFDDIKKSINSLDYLITNIEKELIGPQYTRYSKAFDKFNIIIERVIDVSSLVFINNYVFNPSISPDFSTIYKGFIKEIDTITKDINKIANTEITTTLGFKVLSYNKHLFYSLISVFDSMQNLLKSERNKIYDKKESRNQDKITFQNYQEKYIMNIIRKEYGLEIF